MAAQPTDVRATAIWLAVGMMLLLLVGIELRRRSDARIAEARLWPRPDGSVPQPATTRRSHSARSFGEVWDIVHEAPKAA